MFWNVRTTFRLIDKFDRDSLDKACESETKSSLQNVILPTFGMKKERVFTFIGV